MNIGIRKHWNEAIVNVLTLQNDTAHFDAENFSFQKLPIQPLFEKGQQIMLDISYNRINNSFAMMYPQISTRERCSSR